jgi:hypothetical protein
MVDERAGPSPALSALPDRPGNRDALIPVLRAGEAFPSRTVFDTDLLFG